MITRVPDQDCSSSSYLPYSSECAWTMCPLPSSVSCYTDRTAAVWGHLSTIPPLLKDQRSIPPLIKDQRSIPPHLKDQSRISVCEFSMWFTLQFQIWCIFLAWLWDISQKPVPTKGYLDIETENQRVKSNLHLRDFSSPHFSLDCTNRSENDSDWSYLKSY